jgi:hypothetical protein
MSTDLSTVLFPDEEQALASSSTVVASPKICEEVHGILGEELHAWLRSNFETADPENTGNLDHDQLIELIKLTYVPRGKHLEKFMKWFHFDLETLLINKADYIDGMFKLSEDLSFALSPHARVSC